METAGMKTPQPQHTCPHCGGTHTHTDADGTLWQCQDCYAGQYAPQAPPRGRPRMLDLLTEYKAYWYTQGPRRPYQPN